jgi:hypothetical protein
MGPPWPVAGMSDSALPGRLTPLPGAASGVAAMPVLWIGGRGPAGLQAETAMPAAAIQISFIAAGP